MTHMCENCSQDMMIHPQQCHEEDCEDGDHFPPLCCPECPCGSYAEAHPRKSVVEPEVDPLELVKAVKLGWQQERERADHLEAELHMQKERVEFLERIIKGYQGQG